MSNKAPLFVLVVLLLTTPIKTKFAYEVSIEAAKKYVELEGQGYTVYVRAFGFENSSGKTRQIEGIAIGARGGTLRVMDDDGIQYTVGIRFNPNVHLSAYRVEITPLKYYISIEKVPPGNYKGAEIENLISKLREICNLEGVEYCYLSTEIGITTKNETSPILISKYVSEMEGDYSGTRGIVMTIRDNRGVYLNVNKATPNSLEMAMNLIAEELGIEEVSTLEIYVYRHSRVPIEGDVVIVPGEGVTSFFKTEGN